MAEVKKIPTWLPVVAAAIIRKDGRILMQQRPEGKHHAGLWEFPGGKVEPGETPQAALIREIEEELALVLDPSGLSPACFAEGPLESGEGTIVILLYTATLWSGLPEAREGGAWGWFALNEIDALPKPPLDVNLLKDLERSGLGIAKCESYP